MQLARKQFKVRMDSLSFSLEGRGSTETLEEDKELSLAQLEEIDTKTEAVAGRSVDNIYGKTGAVQLVRAGSDKKACDYDTLAEDQEYIKEIKELHAYLDTVKTMVRPGCSPEVLKIALNSMSTLFNTLTFVSSVTRPHASL
ncbi:PYROPHOSPHATE--FRUCTOSE 6-PHOSPHATE 1-PHOSPHOTRANSFERASE [Salix purpurea]|uniref:PYROPHOSPHATE--FRUCTOSE 6-PHOSPHATE 1-PHOSPHOTRANSFERASE n=1 Tax=Salix purpurea TaxID=77065 RepID=A0A9Q0Q5W4_SALPP|nr:PYROPHOSPHATE--FRUCTOSE 6-PHOSPHATE 1-PHOSPHOTRANSFERASE [Salix purpurea]